VAQIYLDINDIAARYEDIANWLCRGDQVFVTRCGSPVLRISSPTDATTAGQRAIPTTTAGPACGSTRPAQRVLGLHRGTTTPGPDFNDPLPDSLLSGESK
jgi:hypothetical protein